MKNTAVRIVCMILAGVLTAFAVSFTANADRNQKETNPIHETTDLYLHGSIEDPEALFQNTATTEEKMDHEDSGSEPTVIGSVTYTASTTMLDDEHGEINMELLFQINGEEYKMQATGDVSREVLDEQYSLLYGNLESSIAINGMNYEVDIITRQVEGLNSVNAGVSLTPEDFDTNDDAEQIVLYFGTPITETEAGEAYLTYLGKDTKKSDKHQK